MSRLTDENLFDSIDGIFAYDTGCVSSGIHDPILKRELKERLHALAAEGRAEHQLVSRAFNEVIGRYIVEHFIGPDAVERGYGIEDLKAFMRWLEDEMGFDM